MPCDEPRPRIRGGVDGALDQSDKIYASGLDDARVAAGTTTEGRWPANLIHDGSDEVVSAFPSAPGQISAARFFYSAKATKADRAGSKHPTVKPLALMRWLCTLVTPPGGHILDPFAGSGTTLQAAHECGFDATGCERESEYLDDIRARLSSLFRDHDVSEKDTHISDMPDRAQDHAGDSADLAEFLA